MRNPNTVCCVCNTAVYKRPNTILKGPVFCSTKCSNSRFKKPERLCGICGNNVLSIRRARYCSKACANEAIRRLPRKPRGSSGKLRNWRINLIASRGSKCNRCSVDYVPVLEVHHIIERCNGGTDDPENLEILCPTCHAIHHHVERMKIKQGKLG